MITSAQRISPVVTTPDKVETSIGKLEFKDGAPTTATLLPSQVADAPDAPRFPALHFANEIWERNAAEVMGHPDGAWQAGSGSRVSSAVAAKSSGAMKTGNCKYAAAALLAAASTVSMADEGGVSFWLPGQYGSFAAVQGDPGWSLPLVYYHASTDARAGKSFRRGGQARAGLDVEADLLLAVPTYVFAEPVLGGQASVSVAGLFGSARVGVDATLTGPGGGTLTGRQSDSRTGVGDLYPSASLRWNRGVHNYMAYAMAGVPVGAYDAARLANLGVNHWSLDAGGGYTYLDTKSGRESSATLGFTHNFENSDTDYRNGVSGHLDWAASQFLRSNCTSEWWAISITNSQAQRLRGDPRGLQVESFRGRAPDRLLLPGRRAEVVPQPQGLL